MCLAPSRHTTRRPGAARARRSRWPARLRQRRRPRRRMRRASVTRAGRARDPASAGRVRAGDRPRAQATARSTIVPTVRPRKSRLVRDAAAAGQRGVGLCGRHAFIVPAAPDRADARAIKHCSSEAEPSETCSSGLRRSLAGSTLALPMEPDGSDPTVLWRMTRGRNTAHATVFPGPDRATVTWFFDGQMDRAENYDIDGAGAGASRPHPQHPRQDGWRTLT